MIKMQMAYARLGGVSDEKGQIVAFRNLLSDIWLI